MLRKRIESICREHGFEPTVICTPEELMELMTSPRDDKPQDEIIAEVWAIREVLAAEYDYDVDRIYEAIKPGEATSGLRFIEAEPKRIKPVAS